MTGHLDQARDRLRPYAERARGFSGWMMDVKVRRLGPAAPWDYAATARGLLENVSAVLDLGTGGGERFAQMLAGFGGRAVATEEWVVNAPVAAARLRPLGAALVRCDSLRLPFADACFDLVLDRHEALDPSEVVRVLAPGGTVLTQQVWHHCDELARFFPRRHDFGDHFSRYTAGFRDGGLVVVDEREHVTLNAYESLGEYVYELCITPWMIADFDPLGADLEALLDLERELTTPQGIVMSGGSYVIQARKP